jgi:hypothetical protein
MRRTIQLLAIGCVVATLWAAPRAAHGQTAWWGWGQAGSPTTTWDPELVADYVLTGHTPHEAVVRIVAPEQAGTSLGSGVLVDVNRSQGLVLTNWHVVRDSRAAVLVQFPDGFQSAGTVVRWDEAWDLAAVVIWKPKATPVSVASEAATIGEPLTIAGFGRGSYREQTGACTDYLSPGTGYPKEFVELVAKARQGDSGGPIFNAKGELAGVLFGQNDGRTIGSCAPRVRAFLAATGSQGFTPTPIAEFSDARAIDRGLGESDPTTRLASADAEVSVQRAMHVPAPTGLVAQLTPPPMPPQPPPAADPQTELMRLLNPLANGPALLSAAGGLALVLFGLKTIFGGRRRE